MKMSNCLGFEKNIGKLIRVPSCRPGDLSEHPGIIVDVSIDDDHDTYLGIDIESFVRYTVMFPTGLEIIFGDEIEIQEG